MKEGSFTIYTEGSNKVLITAPHIYNHRRPSYSSGLKQAEPFTDIVAEGLAEQSGSHLLIASGATDFDPNYHNIEENPFKQHSVELIQNEKLQYLVDIHGLNSKHAYDFAIYYPKKYYKSKKLAQDIAQAIAVGSFRACNIQVLCFKEGLQESLSQYASKELKVASVQIEIARYIREDQKLREELIKNISEHLVSL